MGIKNLMRRKLRTFLTALGIVIGTVSIVVMVSLGIAMTKSTQDFVDSMGDVTIIDIRPSYDGNAKKNSNGQYVIEGKALEEIKGMDNVEAVTPMQEDYMLMISGKYRANVNIVGMDMSVADKFGIEIEKGRMISKDDRNAIVVGMEVPFRFMNPKNQDDGMRMYGGYGRGMDQEERVPDVNMLEDRLYYTFDQSYGYNYNDGTKKVKPEKIECVGILKQGDWRTNGYVYMDIEQLKKIKTSYERKKGTYKRKRDEGYSQIRVKVNDVKNVKAVQEKLKNNGYNATCMLDWVEDMKKQSAMVQMIFGGIGAISLLVAAIGITNTMIMAIYERRKEIGVMKVIGARIKDIKRLFLLESASIGLIGGTIGLGVSFIASHFLNMLGKNMGPGMGGEPVKLSIIPFWLAASALLFTAFIGLISGYLPARKAMKLSALEAIKND
ncbi:ABC transporter permease [Oceanirhabdus sp. W0125-5]|uniref:ABC transporter permease n=1 Tax=Oceanirhabdus sp. W0125-5 TaxID=2999116 RepID=UPI0022F327DA|nr:ABC transporter permease [Oceanirhabdus sp. W0125-5]WBW98651.1 ABC transporter permease [Oceanirhabdus sp. W0125-5]